MKKSQIKKRWKTRKIH